MLVEGDVLGIIEGIRDDSMIECAYGRMLGKLVRLNIEGEIVGCEDLDVGFDDG